MKTTTFCAIAVSMLVASAAGTLAVRNAVQWSRVLASGEITGTYARPLYPAMPIPPGAGAEAGGKLGADHASLFFDAEGYRTRGRMYDETTDPWRRPAVTFPPHLILLTSYGTGRLSFLQSALINNFVQILLFAAAFAYVLRGSPASWHVRVVGVAAAAFLLFCTPVGTTWFERAQTDFYCATAMLLLLKGMRDDEPRDFVLAGLAASFKWSCLPFVALSAVPYVFRGPHGWRRRLLLSAVAVAVPFALLLFFGEHAVRYLALVRESELLLEPDGVSLQRYVPRVVSKILPFALPLTLLFVASMARRRARVPGGLVEVTFLGAAGMATASFGTIAYEYRFVSLLFLLPLLVDGRSVLFGREARGWPATSRFAGAVMLVYAFRVETVSAVNAWIGFHRGVVPLALGLSVLLLALLAELRPAAPVANRGLHEGMVQGG